MDDMARSAYDHQSAARGEHAWDNIPHGVSRRYFLREHPTLAAQATQGLGGASEDVPEVPPVLAQIAIELSGILNRIRASSRQVVSLDSRIFGGTGDGSASTLRDDLRQGGPSTLRDDLRSEMRKHASPVDRIGFLSQEINSALDSLGDALGGLERLV